MDSNDAVFNETLILLEDICLEMVGKLLIQLGLPAPNRHSSDPINSEITREMRYDIHELNHFVSTNIPKLIDDQLIAFNSIIDSIENQRGSLIFLNESAPGGTGETFLIDLILANLRKSGDIILAVASSGIASTLSTGGRTAHSSFKLPLNLSSSDQPFCGITRNSNKGRLLQQCKAIIWDECTMAHRKSLEASDMTLRDVSRDDSTMGGVVVILAGDSDKPYLLLKGGPRQMNLTHVRNNLIFGQMFDNSN